MLKVISFLLFRYISFIFPVTLIVYKKSNKTKNNSNGAVDSIKVTKHKVVLINYVLYLYNYFRGRNNFYRIFNAFL